MMVAIDGAGPQVLRDVMGLIGLVALDVQSCAKRSSEWETQAKG
jgi:hypothetical protein